MVVQRFCRAYMESPPPAVFTPILLFWVFAIFDLLETTGSKGTSWLKRCPLEIYQLIWHYNPPDSIQSHLNTLQTPYRHPTDTPKCSTFWLWEVTGRKGYSLIWRLLFNCLWFIWQIYSRRYLLDTPQIWSRHCWRPTDTIQTLPKQT